MKSVIYIILFSFGLVASCKQNSGNMKKTVSINKASVIEYVTFTIKPGVVQNDFLEAAKSTDVILEGIKGFSHRFISLQENGVWTETVFWENLELAKIGLSLFLEHPDSKQFLDIIVDDSVKIQYSHIQ